MELIQKVNLEFVWVQFHKYTDAKTNGMRTQGNKQTILHALGLRIYHQQ